VYGRRTRALGNQQEPRRPRLSPYARRISDGPSSACHSRVPTGHSRTPTRQAQWTHANRRLTTLHGFTTHSQTSRPTIPVGAPEGPCVCHSRKVRRHGAQGANEHRKGGSVKPPYYRRHLVPNQWSSQHPQTGCGSLQVPRSSTPTTRPTSPQSTHYSWTHRAQRQLYDAVCETRAQLKTIKDTVCECSMMARDLLRASSAVRGPSLALHRQLNAIEAAIAEGAPLPGARCPSTGTEL